MSSLLHRSVRHSSRTCHHYFPSQTSKVSQLGWQDSTAPPMESRPRGSRLWETIGRPSGDTLVAECVCERFAVSFQKRWYSNVMTCPSQAQVLLHPPSGLERPTNILLLLYNIETTLRNLSIYLYSTKITYLQKQIHKIEQAQRKSKKPALIRIVVKTRTQLLDRKPAVWTKSERTPSPFW